MSYYDALRDTPGGGHIRYLGNGGLWFCSYSDSLWKSRNAGPAQNKQRALPRLSAPRLGSAFPHSGIAPRAAATGRPCPVAAKSASLPICPLLNPCVRPRAEWGSQIKSKIKINSTAA
jgi:hypothetical protein